MADTNVNFIAEEVYDNNKKLAKFVKNKAFDLIAAGLIVAIGLLNLGAIQLREITPREIINIVLETIPFYLGAVSLTLNYYKKGVFCGKSTISFINTVKLYSDKVNMLTGEHLNNLLDFCTEYNNKALRIIQESYLRIVAVTFARFNDDVIEEDGTVTKPLKTMSDEELKILLGEVVAKKVIEAKNVKIKGLSVNVLLGGNKSNDITNIGANEQELLKRRTTSYISFSAVTILILTLMDVKNVMEWGWVGLFLLAFKLLYILCRSYMRYFDGYEDITIGVVNHISRKTDILKQFDYWYNLKNKDVKNDVFGNNIDISSYNINKEAAKRVTTEIRPKT